MAAVLSPSDMLQSVSAKDSGVALQLKSTPFLKSFDARQQPQSGVRSEGSNIHRMLIQIPRQGPGRWMPSRLNHRHDIHNAHRYAWL